MDNFSSLNGASPISPASERVWKIQKKRKADDQDQRNKKRNLKKRKETEAKEVPVADEEKRDETGLDPEDEALYGTAKKRKRVSRKIDVTI